MSAIGNPLDRVDGLLKVTGQARYAGEFPEDGLLYGSVVSSTIAKGRVLRISAQRYNRLEQYEKLAKVLPAMLEDRAHFN